MNKVPIDSILKKISNQTWQKRGRWYHTVVFDEVFNEGEMTRYAEKLGYPFKRTVGVWLPNGDYLDIESEWNDMLKVAAMKYAADPAFFEQYSNDCLKRCQDLLDFAVKNEKIDPTKLSNKELGSLNRSIIQKQIVFMPFMNSLHAIDHFLTEKFDELLNAFIKARNLSRADFFTYQTALTYPYRKILVLQEQEDLLKIAVFAQKEKLGATDEAVRAKVVEHAKKYAWINSILFERLPYTLEDFIERVEELVADDPKALYVDLVKNEKNIKAEQERCMKEIADFPELFSISKSIQVYGFLRSYRVDIPFSSYIKTLPVLAEIAKRLGIDLIDAKYIDSNEVETLLIDPKSFDYRKVIKEREKGFVSVVLDDKSYELTGDDMKKVLAVVALKEVELTDSVKGSTAYPGKVTGTCRVLFSLEDMKKVQKGDIIVISMTDPNYIPAMNRASAFVTDQGGILCHAAIVSREMKKPCVIGTKHATKTFKDGDTVEVDGDSGIVRKIL